VLQVLVPLFIFGLAGVSVTREREAGTLPLLLGQGVSWTTVLVGKLAGIGLVVLAIVTPGTALSSAWMLWASGVAWTADHSARLALALAVHAIFLTACAALAISVSALARSSRGALTALLAIWVAGWIVLPRLLPAAGNALYPVPARAEFVAEVERRVRELGDSHNPNDPRFAEIKAQALARHGVSRVEDLPFNYSGFVMEQGERMTSEAFQRHLGALVAIYQRQARLVDLAGAVSPYLGARMLSMAIAGSDAAHVVEFDRQAEGYRYGLIQQLNTLHQTEVPLADDRYAHVIEGAPSRLRIDRAFFRELPAFTYEPPRLAWSLQARWHGAAAFLFSIALAGALFAWTCQRRPQP
jgi:ABC-2 type transport system permease protein